MRAPWGFTSSVEAVEAAVEAGVLEGGCPVGLTGSPPWLSGYLSTMDALVIALVIVAAILAGIELFRTRGTSLICWAVEAVAFALLVPTLAAM